MTTTVVSPETRAIPQAVDRLYEHAETRALVVLVDDAVDLISSKGEAAFHDFRALDDRWRRGESYVFVLDPDGNMLVHPDPALEGRNQLDLKDISGRPIVRGLIDAATAISDRPQGWYHYQWPIPGGMLPRWKSTYVRLVSAPSGKRYVVGSGMYNDRMERAFVVDVVARAVSAIETQGAAAYPRFRDPTGPFIVKDAYVFVIDSDGVEHVNPAFPNLEGRNLLDLKDTADKPLVREMLAVARTAGSGWVDYMWPKPGESASTRKSTYVGRASVAGRWVLVGCGVYLADAPKGLPTGRMSAPEVMALVREGAANLETEGEQAYALFRTKRSKWLQNDTYLFVWTMDGTVVFHAADPSREGRDESGAKDILGRPFGRMILDVAASPSGEGWVHYMWPQAGSIFPTWKSTFLKRVTFPSGKAHVVGCGVYSVQMDKAFIEDLVGRAAALVAERGADAFGLLRDPTGPFVFMDTYVFVMRLDGTELVNPAQPGFEGKNLLDLKDLAGKAVAREEIAAVAKEPGAWVECYWYKPGTNVAARKLTYVRKVEVGGDTYIVGSGIYPE